MADFRITFRDETETFGVGFSSEEDSFQAEFGDSGTNDHTMLMNREKPDQHPIKAITNLENELSVRTDEALSNLEIYEILQA